MRLWVVAVTAVTVLALGAGTASASPPRLNAAQWAAYQRLYTAFNTQTTRSVARFRSCSSATTGSRNARAMQQCFGNTADLELTATQNLCTLLDGYQKKTSGTCDKSLVTYLSKLFFWRSTITGVKRAVHSNIANAATIEGNASHARQIYPQLQAAAVAYSGACKPKS